MGDSSLESQVELTETIMYGNRGGGGIPFHERKVVFVYGFPPSMDQDTFMSVIQAPLSGITVDRVNYNQDKIMAFIHCASHDDAKQIIDHWRGQTMEGAEKPLQVSFKKVNDRNQDHGGGGGGNYGGGYGGNFGGGNFGRMRPGLAEPEKDENEGHDELGYANQALQISGFAENITYLKALNILSNVGPIHMLFAKGPGNFIVRYCYDLSNGYIQKIVADMAEETEEERPQNPLGIKEKLQVEVIDGTDNWV